MKELQILSHKSNLLYQKPNIIKRWQNNQYGYSNLGSIYFSISRYFSIVLLEKQSYTTA